jgi:hypothetical protein
LTLAGLEPGGLRIPGPAARPGAIPRLAPPADPAPGFAEGPILDRWIFAERRILGGWVSAEEPILGGWVPLDGRP